MSRRRTLTFVCAVAVAATALIPATAQAATVLRLGRHGQLSTVRDPYLPASTMPARAAVAGWAAGAWSAPAGITLDRVAVARVARATRPHRRPQITIPYVLMRLYRRHRISAADRRAYLSQWHAALREERRLPAARRAQLTAVTVLIHNLAIDRLLTAQRLPAVFLTLRRNADWWRRGTLLAYGARVQFYGSQLVWEYYPGAGLQLQVLGTFGEANGLYSAGPSHYAEVEAILNEMSGLAVHRAGGIAWEYYFPWQGGAPGWVSAMAQGTAIQAYTRGYLATDDHAYLQTAESALPLFQHAPPLGVAVRTGVGQRFVQYSFTPGTDIINAFLQSLIGLDTLAQATGDRTAQALFNAGNAQAQAELPSFNTGAWSLYQPGEEDDLSYHQLVTGFLQKLCGLAAAPIYCSTAKAFEADLTTPPTISLIGRRAHSGHGFYMRFKLSKVSRVGIVVANHLGKTLVYTSAQFPYGIGRFRAPALRRGRYTVRLTATDLAGNVSHFTATISVR